MALHEHCLGATDEWFTPPHVFDALGCTFDMDVAHPGAPYAPWVPARAVLTKEDDGLSHPWRGFIWMNAPFGGRNGLEPWLEKFFAHYDGIALAPDRTSAPWWQEYAPRADAVLFVRKKIRFLRRDGSEGKSPAQGTTLMAVGTRGCTALDNAKLAGLGALFGRAR